MIRAVVLDLYGTLVRGGGPRREVAMNEMAKHLGVDPPAFVELFHASANERMRGTLGTIEETLDALAQQLGADPSAGEVRLATTTWQRLHHAILWPAETILATLDVLRGRGYKLALITNCSQETQIQWPKQPLASRMDAVVFSCKERLLKPEPAIYHKACDALGVKPNECLYVGDGSDNELRGAVAVGMRTIRTLEYAYSDPTWTGESIGKLREIIDLLE
jgi:putative hydrolase of the HAD superfamily